MTGGTLRAGVIGVGHLGRIHARIWRELEGVDLVGVADRDEERAAAVARDTGSRAFSSARDLLDEGLDLVSLAVPTVDHAAVGLEVLERGCHLLVEKPIAASAAEADRLIEGARRAGRLLQVGHLERFNPAFRAIQPFLGRPRFIEVHRLGIFTARSLDVDAVLDLMIHDLDLILALEPSGLRQVEAVGVPILTGKVDIANARLTFRSGCVANVTASRVSADKVRKFRIFQQDAYFSLDLQRQEARRVWLERSGGRPEIRHELLPVAPAEPLREEIGSFVAAAREGKRPEVGGEEGKEALVLARRILESLEKSFGAGSGTGSGPEA